MHPATELSPIIPQDSSVAHLSNSDGAGFDFFSSVAGVVSGCPVIVDVPVVSSVAIGMTGREAVGGRFGSPSLPLHSVKSPPVVKKQSEYALAFTLAVGLKSPTKMIINMKMYGAYFFIYILRDWIYCPLPSVGITGYLICLLICL